MHTYRRLTVWQKAHELVVATYHALASVSTEAHGDLARELRMLVRALAGDIAEGASLPEPADFLVSLDRVAAGVCLADNHVLVAADIGAISRSDQAKLEARLDELQRMLTSLRSTVRKRAFPASNRADKRRNAGGGVRPHNGAHTAPRVLPHDPFRYDASGESGGAAGEASGPITSGGDDPDGPLLS